MKEGTKVLRLNLYVLLPDDFEGDLNDALGELLRYRKTLAQDKPLTVISETTHPDRDKDMWADFLASVENGYCLHGHAGLTLLHNNEWEQLPLEVHPG